MFYKNMKTIKCLNCKKELNPEKDEIFNTEPNKTLQPYYLCKTCFRQHWNYQEFVNQIRKAEKIKEMFNGKQFN